ncbi:SAV_915 family protein [Actinomadura fibrosa]|uniref:SAV_915 family protein n=1 Tax=Actinomadura fibrosa TaxID=111802 RepID=A0ABW2XV61_9ACTN|nr:SAV_915 family protein [Actinomadura fibrosa]
MMGALMVVPVHVRGGGAVVLRTGRTGGGEGRVGIAFTDERCLRAALGEDQAWIRLGERALRAMLRPLGIEVVQVDPLLVAPESAAVTSPARTAPPAAPTASPASGSPVPPRPKVAVGIR